MNCSEDLRKSQNVFPTNFYKSKTKASITEFVVAEILYSTSYSISKPSLCCMVKGLSDSEIPPLCNIICPGRVGYLDHPLSLYSASRTTSSRRKYFTSSEVRRPEVRTFTAAKTESFARVLRCRRFAEAIFRCRLIVHPIFEYIVK